MAAPAAPGQIATAPAAVPGPGDPKGWTIEQFIHSIEPRIEEPVPRTEAAPAVPEPEPVPRQLLPWKRRQLLMASRCSGKNRYPPHRQSRPCPRYLQRPEKTFRDPCCRCFHYRDPCGRSRGIYRHEKPAENSRCPPVATPLPTTVTTVPTPEPTPVPTPVVTVAVTTIPVPQTPQVLIPQTGVWVEITYDRNYTGWVGTPNTQQDVTDTGDHFYNIPTAYGTVAASIQKTDGSGDELKVIVYDDGKMVKTVSTTAPSGIIDLQLSLATPTPTPTPVLTPLPTLPLTSNTTTAVNTTNQYLYPHKAGVDVAGREHPCTDDAHCPV